MSLRSWIYNWLMSAPKISHNEVVSRDDFDPSDSSITLRILNAMNGKAIEIRTYTKNPHGGHNQLIQMYIVPESVKLIDALTHVLAIKALEK